VIIVADSSPLIIMAKLGSFDLLKILYTQVHISAEVYDEVVVSGKGLPGAREVVTSNWIEVKQLQDRAALLSAQAKYMLGIGELSTILLSKQLKADAAILDDLEARELAKQEGIQVRGTIGVLETLYRKRHLPDLRAAFQQLLKHDVYISRGLLNQRLNFYGIKPL
jgi:predicted nucleic acid-binding protein